MRRGLHKITGTVFVLGALTFHEKCSAQRIATLTVSSVSSARVPVYVDLDKLTSQPDSLISLMQVKQNDKTAVPFQVEHGYHRFLWWMPEENASGFIHPLWSPAGYVLTRISPPDHRHHFGVWNPWTKVLFEGKEVDFWNLYKKEGTVRFSKFLDEEEGQIFGEFRAVQEHVVLNDPDGEKVAMNEVWDVRAFPVNEKMWICDFTAALT